jgi:hypothetical protein
MTSDRNPTDALNQALSEQRMDGAEKNALEVIARAFELSPEIVYRVIFAFEHLRQTAWVSGSDIDGWEGLIEDDEVCVAIREHMTAGARRVMLREAIERGMGLFVSTDELIGPADSLKICNGCPTRLECVAESLFTPDQCFTSRLTRVLVVPLRMYKGKVDVVATQPQGRYTLPIEAFPLNRY